MSSKSERKSDYDKSFEMLKLITGSEHHFNDLCFKFRVLASTWLLATFAGVGWIIKEVSSANGSFNQIELLNGICIFGSIGIFVLWMLDLRVYQRLLNVWFDAREELEKSGEFPNIRYVMKKLFYTGKVSEIIKYYYMATFSAPLVASLYAQSRADAIHT